MANAMTLPLTDTQLMFWHGQNQQPNMPLYNMAWRFDLYLALDPARFRTALQDVMLSSDILCATFHSGDTGPYQTRDITQEQELDLLDLSSAEDAQAQVQSALHAWVQVPFDLSKGATKNHLVKISDTHWVWCLIQHHIVCDAQSCAVLFQQVSARYDALSAAQATAPASNTPFFESAVFRVINEPVSFPAHAKLASRAYGARGPMSPESARVDIPISSKVHQQLAAAIAMRPFRMLTPDLSRLAVVLTAYIAFLHRVTGDENITVGLPSHNRLSEQDKTTLGPFLEILPCCVDINADDTLSDLHRKTKEALGRFLRSARPGGAASQDTRSISAILNYIQAGFGKFSGTPARAEWVHSGAHDAAHGFRLHVTDFHGSGTPDMAMDVSKDILAATDATNIVGHFQKVLQTLLNAPETPLAALPLSSRTEETAIVRGPQETSDPDATILELISRQAQRMPDAIAVRMGRQQLTYAALQTRSDAIAAGLIAQGFGPHRAVAIHLKRSTDCIAACLGVLKAGCAFVPIASGTPLARVNHIIQSCDAAAIIIQKEDTNTFLCPTCQVDDLVHTPTGPGAAGTPDATAYILFTSGSTGVPKGVCVAHKNFSRYIQWAASEFGHNEPKDYAFFSSISFDLTLTSMFAPLISGGTVVIYPERSVPDLAVLDVFEEDAVDVVKLTPSHAALVCERPRQTARIRTLVLGGETLTRALCLRLKSTLSQDIRLINEYGPTEAVVGAMQHDFDPENDTDSTVSIGRPAPGVTISVRDQTLAPCPIGVTGEIVISGRLAEGYVGQVDEKATKFRDDPVVPGQRIYCTGDLGRLHSSGQFEYLGRSDQQVKLGGVRLELAEIEHAAMTAQNVHAVHVALISSGPAQQTDTQFCTRCGLPESYPNAQLRQDGLCSVCAEYDGYKDRAQAYFRTEPELERQIDLAKQNSTGPYDAIMLLSGGKDSTYAAYRLAEYHVRVLAVTLDNGYISDGAKSNIARVVEHLGWGHRYLSTDKMNAIFVDSLKTHANVCQGCFKAIYTLALRTAKAEGVAMIVTGLSRGQFFETRLTPELFRDANPTCAELDAMVSKARKAYHAENDTLSKLMRTDDLRDGQILNTVDILDIYRFIDVPVSEIYQFLETKTAWTRPSDTGRSTNCLINDVGIHVHKARTGYHNYALPYSWDVRLGHKTRDQAMDELHDEIDVTRVERILEEIGFDEPITTEPRMVVYVSGSDIHEESVWDALRNQLPAAMLPKHLVTLDAMPLTPNGKVDTNKLPPPRVSVAETDHVAPNTPMEHRLAAIFQKSLGLSDISTTRDFFDLGIDSLAAVKIAMLANEDGVALPSSALFDHRSLQALATFADGLNTLDATEDTFDDLIELDTADLASITEALR